MAFFDAFHFEFDISPFAFVHAAVFEGNFDTWQKHNSKDIAWDNLFKHIERSVIFIINFAVFFSLRVDFFDNGGFFFLNIQIINSVCKISVKNKKYGK